MYAQAAEVEAGRVKEKAHDLSALIHLLLAQVSTLVPVMISGTPLVGTATLFFAYCLPVGAQVPVE